MNEQDKYIFNWLLKRRSKCEQKLVKDYFKGKINNSSNIQYLLIRSLYQEMNEYKNGIMPHGWVIDLIRPSLEQSDTNIEKANALKQFLTNSELEEIKGYLNKTRDCNAIISNIINKLIVLDEIRKNPKNSAFKSLGNDNMYLLLLIISSLNSRDINHLLKYFNDHNPEFMCTNILNYVIGRYNELKDLVILLDLENLSLSNETKLSMVKLSFEEISFYMDAINLIKLRFNRLKNSISYGEYQNIYFMDLYQVYPNSNLKVLIRKYIQSACKNLGINTKGISLSRTSSED